MKITITAGELGDKGLWKDFADRYGYCGWALNEGRIKADDELQITNEDAREWGLLPDSDGGEPS